MRGPVLILVGPPGSGKSTVGRLAAEHLGVEFRDVDHDLEAKHGRPAGELVVTLGRKLFQEAERALLSALLPEFTGVVALGGGTPTAPGVPELLEPFHVVYLQVDLDHLLRRDGLVRSRPWLLPDPRARLAALLTARHPAYTAVATATVTANTRAPTDILIDVLATISTRTGHCKII